MKLEVVALLKIGDLNIVGDTEVIFHFKNGDRLTATIDFMESVDHESICIIAEKMEQFQYLYDISPINLDEVTRVELVEQ